MRLALAATRAIARVTVAEQMRSRVVLGLAAGLAAVVAGLALQGSGDGTDVGRARSLLTSVCDVSWALLAVAAVFLSTQTVARELEDGRAVPIALSPAPRASILLGKWLGLGVVLGAILALTLASTALVIRLRARVAAPAGREDLEREILVGRGTLKPPRLETSPGALAKLAGAGGLKGSGKRVVARAEERLREMVQDGRIAPKAKLDEALEKLIQEEVIHALSVSPGHEIEWLIANVQPHDVPSIALGYKYRMVGIHPAGRGPRGVFTFQASFQEPIENRVESAGSAYHELPAPGTLIEAPVFRARSDGIVGEVREENGKGERTIFLDGQPLVIPRGTKLAVKTGDRVKAGDALALSDRLMLRVTYRNVDEAGVVVAFPPEGISVLYPERSFEENVVVAFLVILGRLLFVSAIGLSLATFLDGKVAALVALFVLVVASGHGFLDDALGPVLGGPLDNVFGVFDAPVKFVLKTLLFILPDLGSDDPGEALAQGASVQGVVQSLGGLAGASGAVALAIGSLALSRREIGASR